MFVRFLAVLLVSLVVWAVVSRGSDASRGETPYVVQPGDTLWAISVERYAGDPREGVWRIQRRNRLTTSVLQPGERLMLPP